MRTAIWYGMRPELRAEELKRDLSQVREAGIEQVLVYVYQEDGIARYASRILPSTNTDMLAIAVEAGYKYGLKVQAALVTLKCPSKRVMEGHPDWYMVNMQGISCIEAPPYTEGYRWLCPSREGQKRYLMEIVEEIVSGYDVDGIHLDYIRYPDVILPEAHRKRYGLVQDVELPQYDYCYCEVCRRLFQEGEGVDPLELKDAEALERWRRFRYERLRLLVEDIGTIVRRRGKVLSAAAFATPELSRRYVRQDWPAWPLDMAMPMIYQKSYEKDLPWIRTAVEEGVREVGGRFPILAGLQVVDIAPEELTTAFHCVQEGGADGVAIFSFSGAQRCWRALKEALWSSKPV